MKIIYNKYIPNKGFVAINIFGVVFARKEYRPISEQKKRHEAIHTRQLTELLFIGFYLWYGIEWIVRGIQFRNKTDAYYNISFEREAYKNDQDNNYLKERKRYSFSKYLDNS